MQGKKKYQEQLFTSFQVSDHVPSDNFYSQLKAVLNLQWLYKTNKNIMVQKASKALIQLYFLN